MVVKSNFLSVISYQFLVVLILLVGYGFWVSLAGQPLFKDMLAEPNLA